MNQYRIRTFLLWIIATLLCCQAHAQFLDNDSLYSVWSDPAQSAAERVEAYYARFRRIKNENQNPEAFRWAQDAEAAITLATQIGKTSYLGRFQMVAAGYYSLIAQDVEKACAFSQLALTTSQENRDYPAALASGLMFLSTNCGGGKQSDKQEEILSLIFSLLDTIELREPPAIQKSLFLVTGHVFFGISRLPEALRFYQKVAQLSHKPDWKDEEYEEAIEQMGLIHVLTDNYREAEKYLRFGLELSKKRQNSKQMGFYYTALAENALKGSKRKVAIAYLDSAAFVMKGEENCFPCDMKAKRVRAGIENLAGNYQKALDQLTEMREFYNSSATTALSVNVKLFFAELGKAYLGLQQYPQAIRAAQQGLKHDAFSLYGSLGNYEVMYQSWEALGNHKQALSTYRQYIAIRDSLQELRNSQAVTRLELENQFQQARLADSLAAAQQKFEREIVFQSELSRQKANRNIFLFLGVLAIIAAVASFTRLHYVRKTKQALEEKNRLIEAEKQKAQASEQSKQQFLANMSHEIRTPMNAIKGMTDILLRRDPKEAQLSYLGAIKESSNSLLVIINDILDLSKIEAGKIDLEEIPFSLADVIDNVQTIMQFKAEEKSLLLQSKLPNYLPNQVLGDPTRLHQILLNLVGNAIKFTEKGVVSIELTGQLTAESDQLAVQFCVSDTGVGIGEDRLEKIFESFEQAYSDTTRKFGGTGLGLSISKKLVEIQNGEIWAESEKGKGSQFYVRLSFPIVEGLVEVQAKESSGTKLAAKLKGIRVLLVEDNHFNAIVAQEELEDAIEGVAVDVAENGAIAVEKMKVNSYDMVLMDVQMPVMNGYEATGKIRELADDKASIPIIAMTANVMKEEVDRCYEAGMDDFIGKPFEVEDLLNKLLVLSFKNNL